MGTRWQAFLVLLPKAESRLATEGRPGSRARQISGIQQACRRWGRGASAAGTGLASGAHVVETAFLDASFHLAARHIKCNIRPAWKGQQILTQPSSTRFPFPAHTICTTLPRAWTDNPAARDYLC